MKNKNTYILSLFLVFAFFATAQKGAKMQKLKELEKNIQIEESNVVGLKKDNEAHIIWSDDYKYKKSPIAFVYLHGFGASYAEGEPVMSQLSTHFKANTYMARLEEHGIYRDNTFENLTPENYIASAKQAIAYGKQLGDEVIVISTSTGGTLSLAIAAEDKDIKALVLYSPFIDLLNPAMKAVIQPGGKEQFIKALGGTMQVQKRPELEAKYWSTNYHINGYISLITMLTNTMTTETFSKVTCPVFLGYYYKNEEEQDKVVSVPAMQVMFNALGTPEEDKTKMAFPRSGNHVIASDIRSKDWEGVYLNTVDFLNKIIK
ncbi:esterase/lipase [Cellulophaga sp. RHA19]|uniref:alpha/beta hydrolase n=1 Tax=Cellulophaga sp. RHA19 TaxID=1798237 RepID=UPI000C2B9A2D|nr:alpha/beta hydrolase [Cellulophaga sp. RHA19]PKB43415.1 esterase/lipase [Cellulophaga sp. RHA19]